MIFTAANQGSRAAYDLWLRLISHSLSQFGFAQAADATPVPEGLKFPVDQVAKAAAMTQQMLQRMTQVLEPLLKAGMPDLLAQWTKSLTSLSQPVESAAAGPNALFAPWVEFFSSAAGKLPAASDFLAGEGNVLTQAPLQSLQRAWVDMASRLTGTRPEQFDTSFDRAYGALSDGVGMGPARELYSAWRGVTNASVAQQDARMHYVSLLQAAYAKGFQNLLTALSARADTGERIDSVLALIRLWAQSTEQAVHEVLQSEAGLAATAALMRADLAHRKRLQHASGVMADQFDMASRRELDEAFREIQALKRELRATRADAGDRPAPRARVSATGSGSRSRAAKPRKSTGGVS